MQRLNLIPAFLVLTLLAGCAGKPQDPKEVRAASEQTAESNEAAGSGTGTAGAENQAPDLGSLRKTLTEIIDEADHADGEEIVVSEDGTVEISADPDFISVWYEDLRTGETLSIHPAKFYPCSMVKIVCMVAVYEAIEDGDLKEKEVQDDLEAMIRESDNTAFNVLAQKAGLKRLNQVLKDAGAKDSQILHGLLPGDAWFEADGEGENVMTAADIGAVLRYIYEYPDKAVRKKMLKLLTECEDDSALVQGLGKEAEFAHKTGWADPLYHDGGILFLEDADCILVVLTDGAYMDVFEKIAEAVSGFQEELSEARQTEASD